MKFLNFQLETECSCVQDHSKFEEVPRPLQEFFSAQCPSDNR
jgi:hypothetical protein